MKINRREFLNTAVGMAGILSLKASGLLKLQEVLANPAAPTVIWLQGQACTGCSVSLLNSIYYTTIDDLLINKLNLEYHPNIMAAAGDFALSNADSPKPTKSQLKTLNQQWLVNSPALFDLNSDGIVNFKDYAILAARGFILIVEGAIPTGSNGIFCEIGSNMTMISAMRKFGADATQIIAVGACASFGGIPAASPNPTGALSVTSALASLGIQKSVINIPGCPIHPDWLVGTIIDILTGQNIALDSNKRPTKFYPTSTIHSRCPYREAEEEDVLGRGGCLEELGCKGPRSRCDCNSRKWNNPAQGQVGVNWCMQSGSPCIGCTEPTFPDGMMPFYDLNG
ncbi:MAG: hypothetical protein A2Y10_09645 [Planctomycetes bacterium GWF2_41_51]|nr:MAG: hypothetical protein A2Y10_09645 [Planctomycetes bacterium GWF2_41_51]HBG28264.1 hypothetical protein [Phycisphaerales bacterium]